MISGMIPGSQQGLAPPRRLAEPGGRAATDRDRNEGPGLSRVRRAARLSALLLGLIGSQAQAARLFGPRFIWDCSVDRASQCRAGHCERVERKARFEVSAEGYRNCDADDFCTPVERTFIYRGSDFMLIYARGGDVFIEIRKDLSFMESRSSPGEVLISFGRCPETAPPPRIVPKP